MGKEKGRKEKKKNLMIVADDRAPMKRWVFAGLGKEKREKKKRRLILIDLYLFCDPSTLAKSEEKKRGKKKKGCFLCPFLNSSLVLECDHMVGDRGEGGRRRLLSSMAVARKEWGEGKKKKQTNANSKPISLTSLPNSPRSMSR